MSVDRSCNPAELALVCAYPISAIATTDGCSEIQILLRAVKKIAEAKKKRVSVQKAGCCHLRLKQVCFRGAGLTAERRREQCPCFPIGGKIRGIGIAGGSCLAVAAGEIVAKIDATLQLVPEVFLLRLDLGDIGARGVHD